MLFGLMQRMDLVEKIGSGLMRINEMMDEYLLPHPFIDVSDVYFGISFKRPDLQKMSVEQRIKEYKGLGEGLGENQKNILAQIQVNKNITILKLAKKLNISSTATENNLAKLKRKGLIKRVGSDKSGYWKIV